MVFNIYLEKKQKLFYVFVGALEKNTYFCSKIEIQYLYI